MGIYTGAFEIDRTGTTKEIQDKFIVNETVAEVRAKAEFLEYGYDRQEVAFTTYFSDVNVNDTIKVYAPSYRIPKELNKDRFIVKDIKHYFKDGNIKTKIKAVRYD